MTIYEKTLQEQVKKNTDTIQEGLDLKYVSKNSLTRQAISGGIDLINGGTTTTPTENQGISNKFYVDEAIKLITGIDPNNYYQKAEVDALVATSIENNNNTIKGIQENIQSFNDVSIPVGGSATIMYTGNIKDIYSFQLTFILGGIQFHVLAYNFLTDPSHQFATLQFGSTNILTKVQFNIVVDENLKSITVNFIAIYPAGSVDTSQAIIETIGYRKTVLFE